MVQLKSNSTPSFAIMKLGNDIIRMRTSLQGCKCYPKLPICEGKEILELDIGSIDVALEKFQRDYDSYLSGLEKPKSP